MKVKVISKYHLERKSFTKDKVYNVNNSVIAICEDYHGIINDNGDLIVVLGSGVEVIKEVIDCEACLCGI